MLNYVEKGALYNLPCFDPFFCYKNLTFVKMALVFKEQHIKKDQQNRGMINKRR
jgi:hypothetical protein